MAPYSTIMIPQRDMPASKRADIVFQFVELELPAECKGQWHKDLWSAATAQLDRQYTRDWHAQDRGLYIVYWFGPVLPASKTLKSLPDGAPSPEPPNALCDALQARIPTDRLPSIAAVMTTAPGRRA